VPTKLSVMRLICSWTMASRYGPSDYLHPIEEFAAVLEPICFAHTWFMFGGPLPFRQSVEPVRESPVHPRRGFPLGKAIGFASTRAIKRAFDAEET
jgi:hypothetical protein